jgi:hypothetical protein
MEDVALSGLLSLRLRYHTISFARYESSVLWCTIFVLLLNDPSPSSIICRHQYIPLVVLLDLFGET